MKKLALCVGLLIAGPVWAQDFPFRGQWEVRSADQNYLAIIMIDGERRATWDSPKDQGRPAQYVGYVSEATEQKIVLTLTNRSGVTRTYCDIRTRELLHCYVMRAGGTRSDNFFLVKTGSGPHRLNQPGQ